MAKQQLQGLLSLRIGIGVMRGGYLGPFATYQDVQSHETTDAEIPSTGIELAEAVENGETEVEFYPRIEYEYTVDGTTYTDSRIYHPSQVDTEPSELEGKEFDQCGGAEAVADDYGAGTTATLSYDPVDPAFSSLRDPSRGILTPVTGIGLFGAISPATGLGGIPVIISADG